MISSRGFIRLPLAGKLTHAFEASFPILSHHEPHPMSCMKVAFHLLLCLYAFFITSTRLSAETVVFDLTAPSAGMTEGNELETSGMVTRGGITVTVDAGDGVFNGTASHSGVNSPGPEDDTDTIEAAFSESLSFTLTFTGLLVELIELDFALIGGEDDSALIAINGVPTADLFTGADGFNGTFDTWNPIDQVLINSGDTFTFTADIEYAIQGATFETTLLSGSDNADFNNDTLVDGTDFAIWQRGFNNGTTLATGDANSSGSVDAADLTVWQLQYGNTVSIAAIPEPATVSVALLLILTGSLPPKRQRG